MSREEPRISAGHDKAAAAERIRVLAHVLIYRLGGPVVRLLPGRLLLPVFLGLGRLAHRLNSPRARLLRETFGDVRSELEARDLDELVRAAALSRSRYWYEFLAFRSMTIEEIQERTSVDGLEHLIEAVRAGRGVVVGSLHSRNWDFTMAAIAHALGRTVDVPCGTFVPPPVLDWVIDDWVRHGISYLPPQDAPGKRFAELQSRIERGGVAIVVTDFSDRDGGCEVRLLGRQAFISSGAAALALKTGAPLLSLVSWYDSDGRVRGVIAPAIRPIGDAGSEAATVALTQGLADRFSQAIAHHPEDWHAALGHVTRHGTRTVWMQARAPRL